MDNMQIYNAVREVPQEAQKAFNNGKFSGTDINPMWRIKTLTEQFGPAGIGWYTEIISERSETYGETVMAIVDLNLYVKVNGEWSKPIYGTGGNILQKESVKIVNGVQQTVLVTSDEGYKMAYTDALSVACKALGIGANVYWNTGKDKYVDYAQKPAKKEIDPNELPPLAGAMYTPPPTKREALDPDLLNEAKNMNIDLNKVAVYLKKPVEQITNDELRACIERKRAQLQGGQK